jgi:hypothetical protein
VTYTAAASQTDLANIEKSMIRWEMDPRRDPESSLGAAWILGADMALIIAQPPGNEVNVNKIFFRIRLIVGGQQCVIQNDLIISDHATIESRMSHTYSISWPAFAAADGGGW